MKKVEFKLKSEYGMKSFKLTNITEDDTENDFKNLSKLIQKLNEECIENLNVGQSQGSGKGVNINIEAPKCCSNYAEFNIDRKVPMRQYFGKINKKTKNSVSIWSYGVGSGCTTVGGDIQTTQTRPLSNTMKQVCEILKKNKAFKCQGKYCKEKKNINYNHVTILYYLMDSKDNKRIALKPHCDLEVSASNHVIKNNSQDRNTPTIVLALQSEKNVDFYKRYSDSKKFQDIIKVDTMNMKHGDFFVLHPDDERVFKRQVDVQNGKNMKSQFQHGVICKIDTPSKEKSTEYKLSISVCFCQTTKVRAYSCKSNLLLNEIEMLAQDKPKTKAGIKRKHVISRKREEFNNAENVQRIAKKLKNFHRIAKK